MVALSMSACGGGESGGTPSELPLLALSEAPSLEIGVVEGDPDYQFQSIVSALRVPSGEIVLSDVGGAQITVYGPDGTFMRRFGGEGGGPGEIRFLSRLYWRDDLLLALDMGNDRFSVFDLDGTYRGTRPEDSFSQDSLFNLDVWLYGRYWIDGALEESARASVRAALDRLPPPVASPGFRFVRVADDGRLFVREPVVAADGTRQWTVLDRGGNAVAAIRIPTHFAPLQIDADEILGRWIGEADVHLVRAYRIGETDQTVQTPTWMTAPEPPPAEPAEEEEVQLLIRDAIKSMAGAQEIHYARNYTYTSDVAALTRFEPPEGLEVTIFNGDRRGWSAAFTHPGFDRVCALGYGGTMPPGWTPGMIICAPPRSVPDAGAS